MPCRCGLDVKDYKGEETQYEEGSKVCEKYSGVAIDSFSTPRWNTGLGCHTSSVRETEKLARKRGLEPIGSAKVEEVFKPREETSSRQIAHEMMKEYRNEHRKVVI